MKLSGCHRALEIEALGKWKTALHRNRQAVHVVRYKWRKALTRALQSTSEFM